MRKLIFQFKQMCDRSHGGSYSTQASREHLLSVIATDIEALGFRNLDIASLQPKHVQALVACWQARGLSEGSIKNLMSAVRYWAAYIGKENVVLRTNAEYGIGKRVLVTNVSKANEFTAVQVAAVRDPYTQCSLALAATFGLRREEAIKINPSWADLGDRLRLKDSWTKGGKYREIPIATTEQRAALDAAKALAEKGSLIPATMRYKEQMQRFKAECRKAGIAHVHGLRHRYAQQRYEAITGLKAPACGGPSSRQLTAEQRLVDQAARMLISKELGHEREQITAVYLGR